MSGGDRNYWQILLTCDHGNFSKMVGVVIAPKNLKPSIQSVSTNALPNNLDWKHYYSRFIFRNLEILPVSEQTQFNKRWIVTSMVNLDNFTQKSTEDLKQAVLRLVTGRDGDSLAQKNQFYKTELAALFAELQQRNPVPVASDQASLVQGVWLSLWSTIPFQDIFPGRIRDQSYQIFHPDGYYANMARYAPGSRLPLLKNLSSWLVAYDFMLIQRYEVKNQQWLIQNVGVEQALRIRAKSFTVDVADAWFTKAVASPKLTRLKHLDRTATKKVEKILQATPQLEHLYCDSDFRIVKTQRESKQRASYTIAIRKF